MSKSLGPQLPSEVLAMLSGDDLQAGSGLTFTLAETMTAAAQQAIAAARAGH